MKIALGNAAGWIGAAFHVSAYWGLTAGDLVDHMATYHVLVAAGCVLLGVGSAILRSWPSLVLQVFFIVIAAWGIYHPRPVLAMAAIEITMIEPPVRKVKAKVKAKRRFSCADVRQAVTQYGAAAVEQEARRRGVSEADITRVKTVCI